MLRCLIVDDNVGFRTAARRLLERQGTPVCGVASTAAEAVRRAEEDRPDVVLVDIDLGGESGFDAARQLSARLGPVAPGIILISTHAEQDYLDLIADSPALGFLPKARLSARAIHEIVEGRATGFPDT